MAAKKPQSRLSKSRYTRGIKCHKSLWLLIRNPELREEPDAGTQARFLTGHEVGEVAWQLFPGGTEIPFENLSFDDQLRLTQDAMKTSKVIYEAAFCHDGVFIKVDILTKNSRGWELYEVKSSIEVKDVYQHDIDVQYYVLNGAGVKVTKACIVNLNRDYVREGDLDITDLFSITNVTKDTIARQGSVKKEVALMQRMMQGKVPKIDIGPHCSDPYPCDFKGHCWSHIPDNSVFDLTGNGVKKFDLYRKGIVRLEDALDSLKGKQLQQAEATLNKKVNVEKKELRAFLDRLQYPLCFLDFETFMSAIPAYDGLRPYQQVNRHQFFRHSLI